MQKINVSGGNGMSMINCPECNKEISNQAKVCPNCGMPVYRMKYNLSETKSEKKAKPNILSVTAIGIAIIALIMSFGNGVYAMGESVDDEYCNECDDYCDECEEYCEECEENYCTYDDCECQHSKKPANRKNEKGNLEKETDDSEIEEVETTKEDESTALDSDEFENKVVLINFWATWCGYCVDEMPDLQKIYDEYKDNEDVEIIAVNVGESKNNAQLFMDSNNYTIPVEFDSDSELFGELDVNALPYTIIINKDGEIAKIFDGATDYDAMKKAIDASL